MLYHLGEVADIFSGYHFRGRVKHEPHGDLPVLQIKDLPPGGILFQQPETHIVSSAGHAQRTVAGDLILQARGTQTSHAFATASAVGVLVPSTFIVIRPDTSAANPAYVAWYFQQLEAQEYLERIKTGSTLVRVIMPKHLRKMPVPLPPLHVQNAIGQVHLLSIREKQVQERLTALRNQTTQQQLRSSFKKWKNKQ